jgi:hypothetical protein
MSLGRSVDELRRFRDDRQGVSAFYFCQSFMELSRVNLLAFGSNPGPTAQVSLP